MTSVFTGEQPMAEPTPVCGRTQPCRHMDGCCLGEAQSHGHRLDTGATYYFTFRGTNAVDSFWADKVLTLPARRGRDRFPPPTLPVTNGLACWYDAAVGVTTDAKGAIQDLERPVGQCASRNARRRAPRSLWRTSSIRSQSFNSGTTGWPWPERSSPKSTTSCFVLPVRQWSGPGGLLGRLKGRGSSYNTWGKDTGFWQDHAPVAVTRNGTVLPGPAFDCSPLTNYMVLKIVVDDSSTNAASYAIGNNDGLAACDFDVAEILGYQSMLSPADEALVGGYLAAKYGIDTAYPPLPPTGLKPAASGVVAGETASAKYRGWQHSGSMYLLTTPEGANLPATASGR